MRIIAGTARGRRLAVPAGRRTRPTSDRVREALFSRLDHDGWLDGARVLDLYAGSGALGLEAASRGARAVLLVDRDPAAVAAIRGNITVLGEWGSGVDVRGEPVARLLAGGPPDGLPYDLVLADPPYDVTGDQLAIVLAGLSDAGWLNRPALVVVERATRDDAPRWPVGWRPLDDRRYGDTRLWFAEVPLGSMPVAQTGGGQQP
ncbi:MAG: 16S rRNA (guanine(966)-N(2))-methyltransferase RsmD [Angustibacter sp.]